MTVGALTLANPSKTNAGPWNLDRLTFAGDNSYPTGGTAAFQALVRAKMGDNRTVLAVLAQDCGGYFPVYDFANDKLKVYRSAGSAAPMAEVPNTTDLSGVTFNVLIASM